MKKQRVSFIQVNFSQVYSPTKDAGKEMKEEFYAAHQEILNRKGTMDSIYMYQEVSQTGLCMALGNNYCNVWRHAIGRHSNTLFTQVQYSRTVWFDTVRYG